MFCCLGSKKILSSAIEPSPAFQSKVEPLNTRYPKSVEILKVIDSLKKLKEATSNQLLDNVPSNK